MITVVNHVHVLPENAAEFEELMTYVASMSNEHEPGVLYYAFARSTDEADTYVVVEGFRDQAACTAHGNSDWVQQSAPKSAQLIASVPRIAQYASPGTEPVSGMAVYATRLRLANRHNNASTRSSPPAITAAMTPRSLTRSTALWEQLRQEDLDAAYAAAVADNPSYRSSASAARSAALIRWPSGHRQNAWMSLPLTECAATILRCLRTHSRTRSRGSRSRAAAGGTNTSTASRCRRPAKP
jgi:quinol monooxygenase YgiN